MKYKNKNNSKNSKLKTVGVLGCSTLLALSAFSFCTPAIYAPANVHASQSSPFSIISIENSEFNSTSTSSYPQEANNWTKITANSGIKAGVINLSDTRFGSSYEDYGLFKTNDLVIDGDSTNVYMMNAMENQAIYGIQSDSITLDAGSNYVFSFKVRTSIQILKNGTGKKINNSASAYLMIDNKQVMSKVDINTNGDWTTYYFFVRTSFEKSSSANIQLYLGSKESAKSGAVLFDKITCIKCTDSYYANKNTITSNKCKAIDANKNLEYVSSTSLFDTSYNSKVNVTSEVLNDSSFADESKWTKTSYNASSIIHSGIINSEDNYIDSFTITSPGLNNIATDNHVLAMSINQDDDKTASVVYTSESFTLKRYTNYMFQFYVKTSNTAGEGLHASIVPTDTNLSAIKLSSITSSENVITNDWTKCTIYVQGNAFKDIEAKLEFGLGSVKDKTTASGLAFVDDISVYKVSYESYTNAETSSTIAKGTLTSSSNTSSDSKITNPNFDIVSGTAGDSLPYAPSNWTASNEDGKLSGIINNKIYSGTQYGGISWDGIGLTSAQASFIDSDKDDELNKANQNLLMIRTADCGYQSYSSDKVELTASTLYKLSVDAKVLAGSAYINLNFGDDLVYSTKIVQSKTFNLYDIYFITPMNSVYASVELGMGSKTNNILNGYSFFDNVYLTTITTTDSQTPEEKLEELQQENEDIISINLKSDYFSFIEDSINSSGLYSSLVWNTGEENGVTSGINATNNSLMIASTNANTDYSTEAKYTHKLDSSKYYKITYTLFTSAFTGLDTTKNGAVIGFSERDGNNEVFANIISETESSYSFYIKGSELETVTPYVKLVTNSSTEEQYVQLTGLTIEEIDETTFKAKQTELEAEPNTNIIMLGEVEDTTDEDSSSESSTPTTDVAIWNWVIPTITTCLAILLAIIGLIIKKINKKVSRKGKKYSNVYDRESTVHKSIIDKEAENLRQEKIEEVKKKLLATQEKLKSLEDDYKEKTSVENVNKEAEYKKLVRSRKKHAKKEIELKEELDYLQSDDYLDTARAEIIDREMKKYNEDNVIEKDDIVEEIVDTSTPSTNEVIIEAQDKANNDKPNTDNNK